MTTTNLYVYLHLRLAGEKGTDFEKHCWIWHNIGRARAIFYYLCRNPNTYTKLRREVLNAEPGGRMSTPVIYAEVLQLEYLSAVINETL